MDNFLEKIPYPIAGLMLALATLGNVLGGYHTFARPICGLLSLTLLMALLLKWARGPKGFTEALNHPLVGSVLCTLPMGVMVLATYMVPVQKSLATGLWALFAEGAVWSATAMTAYVLVGYVNHVYQGLKSTQAHPKKVAAWVHVDQSP